LARTDLADPPGRGQYCFLAETEESLNRRLRGFRRYHPDCRFKLQKRRPLFIRTHNETLSVVAVRVRNEDRSPVGINRRDTAKLQPALLRLSAMISHYGNASDV
jgi:hypothetical protein